MTITTTLTALATDVPSRNDPDNFRTEADAAFDWLVNDFFPEMEDVITEINTTETGINTSETNAASSETNAASSEAVALAAANFKGNWADLTGAAAIPYSVLHDSDFWMLNTDLPAGVDTKEPGVDVEWTKIYSRPQLYYSARTANAELVLADHAYLIDITANTFTQTFDACASLRHGWYCFIRNSGTGLITLDPNVSETIDGLTSFVMYPNECRLIHCTGTALFSRVINSFRYTFTSSGTFTKPPGYRAFECDLISGGGSGAKGVTSTHTHASGGGGGGRFNINIPSSSFAATETVTVGAGGAAKTSAASNGAAGGASSVGALISVAGGSAGAYSSVSVPGGFGGGMASNVSTITAMDGFGGGSSKDATYWGSAVFGGGGGGTSNYDGGTSVFGGGGGGGITEGQAAKAGGTSAYGGAGGASADASDATAGTFPGGGGGATITGSTSGAGANGRVIISGVV